MTIESPIPAPTHRHDWQPIPNKTGKYVCASCGINGYRAMAGRIAPYASHRRRYSKSGPNAIPQSQDHDHHRAGKRGPGGW